MAFVDVRLATKLGEHGARELEAWVQSVMENPTCAGTLVFWGPGGVGKTLVSRVLEDALKNYTATALFLPEAHPTRAARIINRTEPVDEPHCRNVEVLPAHVDKEALATAIEFLIVG